MYFIDLRDGCKYCQLMYDMTCMDTLNVQKSRSVKIQNPRTHFNWDNMCSVGIIVQQQIE